MYFSETKDYRTRMKPVPPISSLVGMEFVSVRVPVTPIDWVYIAQRAGLLVLAITDGTTISTASESTEYPCNSDDSGAMNAGDGCLIPMTMSQDGDHFESVGVTCDKPCIVYQYTRIFSSYNNILNNLVPIGSINHYTKQVALGLGAQQFTSNGAVSFITPLDSTVRKMCKL